MSRQDEPSEFSDATRLLAEDQARLGRLRADLERHGLQAEAQRLSDAIARHGAEARQGLESVRRRLWLTVAEGVDVPPDAAGAAGALAAYAELIEARTDAERAVDRARERESAQSRPGPRPLDPAAVQAAREALRADGKPSGERSIATYLGVSRDAVRYAVGKDRRRKS